MTTAQVCPKQKIYIDPFDGKLFDFDNVSSKVYLAETINNLLRAYGNNFVIEGFKVLSISYELDEVSIGSKNLISDLICIDLSPGRAVIDSTYIEVTEQTRIVYDVTNLDDSGFLIISLEYNYLHTPYENRSILKVNFFNSAATNNIIEYNSVNNNSSFFIEIPRVILNKIQFNKQTKTITKYTKYYNTDTNKITLLNKQYEIYPKSPLLKDFIRILQDAK